MSLPYIKVANSGRTGARSKMYFSSPRLFGIDFIEVLHFAREMFSPLLCVTEAKPWQSVQANKESCVKRELFRS
jgi:hypothetical protein